MLKKESKLNAEDLLKLKKEGKRVYSTLFSVTWMPADVDRFAVHVPKKVYKIAVDRNRCRRRVYSAIEGIPPKTTGYYEIFVKSKLNTLEHESLIKEIKSLLCPK